MANLNTAKTIEVMFDEVVMQLEEQNQMAMLCGHYNMAGARTQNSNNIEWRVVEQQAATSEGWEFVDADFTSLVEQSFPSTLGMPQNGLLGIRVDDLRDPRFKERWAKAEAQRLSAQQNQLIATTVVNTGSIFYRLTTAGYDFIKTADTILKERQTHTMGQSFFVNDRNAQQISSDLANRSNMHGLPETVYKNGMMAYNTGGFDIYEASYLPSLSGGTLAGVTVTSAISQAPVGFTTTAGTQVPVDYRISEDIELTGTLTNLVVGDYITFANVNAVGLQDKTNTGQLMTFKVVEKTGQNIKVYPKPIAADDAGLTAIQQAYANINTQIGAGAAVTKLNTDTSARTNVFWANDSIEIVDGDAPWEMLGDLDGMEVKSATLASGTRLYMIYQASINNGQLKCRLFTWNNVVNKNPSANGVAILGS
jgi:Tfp pilus assembly protein PilX